MKNQANKMENDLQMHINEYEEKMPPGYFNKPTTIKVAIKHLHRYIEEVSKYVLEPRFEIEISATASAETLVEKMDNPKERNRNRCLQFMGIYQAMKYLDKQFERQMDTPHFNSKSYKIVHHCHVAAIRELNRKIEVVEDILYTNDPVLGTKAILEIFEPKPEKIRWDGTPTELCLLMIQMERKNKTFLGHSNYEKVNTIKSHFQYSDAKDEYLEQVFKDPDEKETKKFRNDFMKYEEAKTVPKST